MKLHETIGHGQRAFFGTDEVKRRWNGTSLEYFAPDYSWRACERVTVAHVTMDYIWVETDAERADRLQKEVDRVKLERINSDGERARECNDLRVQLATARKDAGKEAIRWARDRLGGPQSYAQWTPVQLALDDYADKWTGEEKP